MTRTVLAVGAHPDDEVLGAGGTLAKHAAVGDEVHVLIVTEGTTAQYDDPDIIDEKKAAARDCGERLGVECVHFGDLPDMGLDETPHVEINAIVEETVASVDPDIVYTHSPHEVNQDHVRVYQSTLVATRPQSGVQRVLTYETPSSTDWVGGDVDRFAPTTYVDIEDQLEAKLTAFEKYEVETRAYPHPRSREALEARARTRGSEAGFQAAEAFSLVREYCEDV